jgi:hypothetical protein
MFHMEIENWKNLTVVIEQLRGKYEISDLGRIQNKITGEILSQHIRNGYKAIGLNMNNCSKTYNVHPLVAFTFLDITRTKGYIVNHKNGKKFDNRSNNLEYITYKDNSQHALEMGLFKPHPVKVNQYDLKGNFLKQYDSIKEAATLSGANDRHISGVCKGKRKTTGGFIWKYTNEEKKADVKLEEGKIIENYPNYVVFKNGDIYSKKHKRILKPKILPSGYNSVKLCNNGQMRDYYIHVLVASAFLEKDKIRPYVNHKDKNKSNNKLDNLEYVTHPENMKHHYESLKIDKLVQ